MDITDDRLHSTLYRMVKTAGAPDYVLDAPVMDAEKAAELPDALFADRANRRFPIDSRASTWTSAAYFAKTASEEYRNPALREYVGGVIKSAADKYGIRADVDAVMDKVVAKPVEKKAADDESNYGWPAEKKYPMFDEEGVKLANSYFSENAFRYTPAMRREIASRIMAKSAEYGIETSRAVFAESGNGFNVREHVAYQLMDRASSCTDPDATLALKKLASAVADAPAGMYGSIVEKAAELLSRIDEETGAADRYGSRFESPMSVFFGRTVKEAQSILDDTVQLGGAAFSARKLAQLPMSVFADALGDDFARRVKMAELEDNDAKSDEPGSKPGHDAAKVDKDVLDEEKGENHGFDAPESPDMSDWGIDPEKLSKELKDLGESGRTAVFRSITCYIG